MAAEAQESRLTRVCIFLKIAGELIVVETAIVVGVVLGEVDVAAGAVDAEEVLDLLSDVFGTVVVFVGGGGDAAEVALVCFVTWHCGGGVGGGEELGHAIVGGGDVGEWRRGMVDLCEVVGLCV